MLLQKLQPDDHHRRTTFCTELQALMEEDDFFERLIFSDEFTFHLCRKVNRYNVRIWGTENPKSVVEVARDFLKVNVFCAMPTVNVYGSFFFSEQTITGIAFLDMLPEWLLPKWTRTVLISYCKWMEPPAPFPPTRQRIFKTAFTAAMDRARDRWWSDGTRLATLFSRCNPMWFLSMGLRQGSGLCPSSSRKYHGTEGTNQNGHWNHHRWHATNSLERTRLSCWCL